MLALVPITTYAIFYAGELEFSDCATMIVSGQVHANADICDGSASALTFNGAVTCSSVIWSPERGGVTYTPVNENVTFNASKATNKPALQLSIPMTNTHAIIDFPAPLESPTSTLGRQREYNLAQVVLIVSNSPWANIPQVTLQFQVSRNGNPPGNNVVWTTNKIFTNSIACTNIQAWLSTNPVIKIGSFLSLTNTFTDQRQNQANMFVTQIDVGQYAKWLLTNAIVTNQISAANDDYPTILYVADCRYIGTNKASVVRLMNAQALPPNNASGNLGFSVATPNPLYVWGPYNTTIDGVHFATAPGSTTNGYSVPAALFSDAITILSTSWSDALSGGSYSSRNTVQSNMTLNAAIITGNVPSTGTSATTFSGGVHNLTRFLENWSGVTLTYNTSIVCLFQSQMATNQFQMPGTYYNPPTRNWGFDPTFYNINQQPPGVPEALVPIRYNWTVPPPTSSL
jgi:hypothetical protein